MLEIVFLSSKPCNGSNVSVTAFAVCLSPSGFIVYITNFAISFSPRVCCLAPRRWTKLRLFLVTKLLFPLVSRIPHCLWWGKSSVHGVAFFALLTFCSFSLNPQQGPKACALYNTYRSTGLCLRCVKPVRTTPHWCFGFNRRFVPARPSLSKSFWTETVNSLNIWWSVPLCWPIWSLLQVPPH